FAIGASFRPTVSPRPGDEIARILCSRLPKRQDGPFGRWSPVLFAVYAVARRHRRVAPLPLLRITQTASRVTTVDGRVAAIVAVALFGALAVIWRDELPRLLPPRIRRAVGVRIAVLAVFFAVLPAVLPYDPLLTDHGPV